jgi:hypothetical protein
MSRSDRIAFLLSLLAVLAGYLLLYCALASNPITRMRLRWSTG